MNSRNVILYVVLFCLYSLTNCDEKVDYYKLLNVPRDATVQEVRKAFKILAVKLHPDKNKDDSDAEQKFIQLAKAYEILKDPTSRKEYDLHGDSEFNNNKRSYHSYSYYKDHFGIYDDDPIIVTLSKQDYELNILDVNQAWFVNFYSPHCHHCHEMAPIWRKLASQLEGVVRIAAVNCEEDYPLCYQLSIEAYPTLLFYEKEAHIYDGEKFRGSKTLEALEEYILSKVHVNIEDIDQNNWPLLKQKQWVLFLCSNDNYNCPEKDTITKISATLEGLLSVGIVKDSELCEKISESFKKQPIIFWQIDATNIPEVHIVEGSDSKEILDKILNILPTPPLLDEKKFHDLRTKLRMSFDKPWLICFYLGEATDLKLELKRLPTLISNINIGLIHCGKSAGLCATLHIARYPTWCVIKQGGAFEVHQGRDVLHEVASFARDSTKSTNLHALSPADFHNLMEVGTPWYIDWYAPWCPPCKRLTPELRKASQHFEPDVVQFGTVDCTLHRELCFSQSISSYPTMVLYNRSSVQRFQGVPNEGSIVEFIQDAINPLVKQLDENNFSLLARKSAQEMWVVDFFAPWCGPCQQLAPEYRKLAKSVAELKNIVIAQVDCVANEELCSSQNIRGYPTIRLYPLGSKGLSTVAIHNGHRDAVSLKRWIIGFLPSKVDSLTETEFKEQILTENFYLPWLVDFYAPWCSHCVHFEPEFRTVAQRLDGKVRSAKIDCEAHRIFCGYQGVSGYPAVRLYMSPQKHFEIDSQNANEIIQKVKYLLEKHKRSYSHDEL
ncbi:dnaJ homolog subfamily C member 10 isoform X1 [Dendroctonus ponderosae]|uniref:dnaJ homolog subfamily C member 10 isoform X1 n=1 Tax=Dendroctonus ponderosae TaxID=77166 RepID=UPI002034EE1E|nr:dnaJ homolog subfamily C member 10 isoform X1 [Dendroctonus ponderosae]XP_048522987.1 dnaJ homolog subfamily C member 10 isoform X1 [Dendroctonus ponderosae]